jgi:hypothetical protein
MNLICEYILWLDSQLEIHQEVCFVLWLVDTFCNRGFWMHLELGLWHGPIFICLGTFATSGKDPSA